MRTLFAKIVLSATASVSVLAEVIPRLHDEYDPQKWPQAELKLSQAGTLKDVFDSGLRPYRFPYLEKTTLELKHVNLTMVLDSGKRLPAIPMEWMQIKVFTDGELATIEAATPKLTLEQARQQMLKWMPYSDNGRTESDLNEYLAAAEADFLDFDDPYRGIPHGCGIGWKEPGFGEAGGGAKVGVGFRKTASPSHPLSLYFGISWGLNRPSKDRISLHPHPIPPPPGYEDVDMTAPEKYGPDSAVDILRSQGYDIGDGKGGKPIPGSGVESEVKPISEREPKKTTKPPEDEITVAEPEVPNRLLWIIAGAILLVILTLLFKAPKGKSGS